MPKGKQICHSKPQPTRLKKLWGVACHCLQYPFANRLKSVSSFRNACYSLMRQISSSLAKHTMHSLINRMQITTYLDSLLLFHYCCYWRYPVLQLIFGKRFPGLEVVKFSFCIWLFCKQRYWINIKILPEERAIKLFRNHMF